MKREGTDMRDENRKASNEKTDVEDRHEGGKL